METQLLSHEGQLVKIMQHSLLEFLTWLFSLSVGSKIVSSGFHFEAVKTLFTIRIDFPPHS